MSSEAFTAAQRRLNRAFVPAGWEVVRLGDVFKPVVDTGHKLELPILSVTIGGRVVRRSSLDRRSDRSVAREKYLRVLPGDIAYNTMRMWQGASGLVGEEGYISPAYTVCRLRQKESPEFWATYFHNVAMIRAFRDHSQGFAKDRYRLYYHNFATVPAFRPPLAEQRKIAGILYSIDETIEKTQTTIKHLQLVKNAVMEDLLLHGAPKNGDRRRPLSTTWKLGRLSDTREIPESWELVELSTVARLESGHTPSRNRSEYWNGGVPWVSLHDSKHLDVPEILETEQSISYLGIQNSSARLLPKGTVVFSRTATVGKSTVLGRDMATSQDFANFVCGQKINNRYLMHLFRNMGKEWKRLMAGSTHQTIYMPVFQGLQVLLPPLDEQKLIATAGDLMEECIGTEKRLRERLRNVRSVLLQGLFSGEIRVPPDEAAL